MIKKVKVEQLRPGVFVDRFDSGWLSHPFLFNRKRIKDRHAIDKMKEWGVEHVYIDTDRGLDVEDGRRVREPEPESAVEIDFVESGTEAVEPPLIHVPFQEAIVEAKVVRSKARRVIHRLLDDARGGNAIDIDEAHDLVTDMDNSVRRNKDALLLLMQVRNRDEYTFMHSVSVGALLIAFCRSMGLDGEAARTIGLGGLLHDVGKMGVPLDILNKPASLTEAEFAIIKQHAVYCRDILEKMDNVPETAALIARQHHERFDGTGYPYNLKGDEISPAAQMAGIVDVFDAITADRCYHNGMDQVSALRKIYGMRGSHFNEKLVQRFIRCVGVYPPGTVVRLASGRIGVVVENTDNLLKPLVRVVYDASQDWAISPRDINLAREDPQTGDRIVGYESPHRWRIDPFKVLGVGVKLL
ncbi:MAG: HD-GYP domain-containing protein [Desulfobulbaceae bacterium]|nr:HD-GYP domain-containing protein [Desulfobulbaceae bacterium]